MSLYEYLIRAENAHRKLVAAEREEKDLSTPIIRDYHQMGEIYNIIQDELARKTDIKPNTIEGRRVFIFIIIRLCYPAVLVGKKLKKGIRDEIAATLGCEASVVSHDLKNLTFQYKKYKSFQRSVDEIFNNVMGYLQEK